MSVIDTVRTYLSDSEPVVSECRRCGTSVENGTERCPDCDSTEIARHHVG
jgi:rubrerythrin